MLYIFVYIGATSLDRRPTTILVSDIDIDIKDAVLAHMSKFGEVVDTTGMSIFYLTNSSPVGVKLNFF